MKYSKKDIRDVILWQSLIFLGSGVVYAFSGDIDKWFTRWALGILLLSAWGIMKHISGPEIK